MSGPPPIAEGDPRRMERLLTDLDPHGPHGLDILFAGLGHNHWRFRQMALAALPRFGLHPGLMARLVESLGADDNIGLRNACIQALVGQGQVSVAPLLAVLQGADEGRHKFVAEVLGQIGGNAARDGLLRVLDRADTMTFAAVVEALGTIGGDNVTQELVRRLHRPTEDPQQTLFILDALGRGGARLPVSVLLPLAKERVLARVVFRLLGTCGNLQALPALLEGSLSGAGGSQRIALHALAALCRESSHKSDVVTAMSACERSTRDKFATKVTDMLGEQDRETVRDAIYLAQYVASPALGPRIMEVGMARGLAEVARQTVLSWGGQIESPLRGALDKVDPQTQSFMLDVLATLRGPIAAAAAAPRRRSTAQPSVLAAAGTGSAPNTGEGMGREQFARLADIVSSYCGIVLPANMQVFIEHRLQARLEALSLDSFAAYLALLRHEGPAGRELDELVELIVTRESFFFRERPQLRVLTDEIIPSILRQHPQRLVRMWCAGCSTGEEPYTLAMLLDKLGFYQQAPFEIFASDISRKAIRQAKAGVYRKFSLRDTAAEDVKKFFSEDGALFTVNENIRKRVGFGLVNLLDENTSSFLTNVDVVLCRNVMIYFSNTHRKVLLRHLHKRMRPGGYLLLGHSESLINASSDFDVLPLKGDIVYRKPEGT